MEFVYGYLILLLIIISYFVSYTRKRLEMTTGQKVIVILIELLISISMPVITFFIFLNNFESQAFIEGLGALFVAVLVIPGNIFASMILNYFFRNLSMSFTRVLVTLFLISASIGLQVFFSIKLESGSSGPIL